METGSRRQAFPEIWQQIAAIIPERLGHRFRCPICSNKYGSLTIGATVTGGFFIRCGFSCSEDAIRSWLTERGVSLPAKPRGRPPVEINPAQVRELYRLLSSDRQVADKLRIASSTLHGRIHSDPEIAQARAEGMRAREEALEEHRSRTWIEKLMERGGIGIQELRKMIEKLGFNYSIQSLEKWIKHGHTHLPPRLLRPLHQQLDSRGLIEYPMMGKPTPLPGELFSPFRNGKPHE